MGYESNYEVADCYCPNCDEMFTEEEMSEFLVPEKGECAHCKIKVKFKFGQYYAGKEEWYTEIIEED